MTSDIHIEDIDGIESLIVDGKPFLALAGEVRNSSASSSSYLKDNVWKNIAGLNLNTILAPVYWELIEQQEGHFDFSSVASLIDDARQHNMKLILLWFGLWKNGLSTYIPKWMKLDREKYPFVRTKTSDLLYSISPFSESAINKDIKAYKELMEFINKYDEKEKTVIMMQIENEVGILHADFDYSHYSIEKISAKVPLDVANYCSKTGDWVECFGMHAKEYFLAYHYAKAIDSLAKAGKTVYDIPVFVNSWLEKPGTIVGEYPLGGPTARMYPFWKFITESIDYFAPDIYVPNFSEICDEYSSAQNVLIIPETRQDIRTISNLVYAVGNYNLICFSPFAIEDFQKPRENIENSVLNQLSIDQSAFNPDGTAPLLAKAYKLINDMWPVIHQARIDKKIYAFRKKDESDRGTIIKLNNCNVRIKYHQKSNRLNPTGFIMLGGQNELYIVGLEIGLELYTDNGKNIGILTMEEGSFIDNEWKRNRILNGDERYSLSFDGTPKVIKLEYHLY